MGLWRQPPNSDTSPVQEDNIFFNFFWLSQETKKVFLVFICIWKQS